MDAIRKKVESEIGGHRSINSFNNVYRIHHKSKVRYWFLGILIAVAVMLLLPWTQNIRAKGFVTTLRQEQRPQQLNTIIAGRIIKWHVKEGDFVKEGDTIVQLAEIKDDYLDPQLLSRTKEQMNAKESAVENYRNKIGTVDQQMNALIEALALKLQELQNKIDQQKMKIRSDSMEFVAAINDYSIKSLQLVRQQAMYDSGLVSLVQLEQRNQAKQDALAKRTTSEIKLNNARQEMIRFQLELNGERQQYLEKISKTGSDRFQSLSQIATGEGELSKLKNQYSNYSIRNGQYILKAPQSGQVVGARRQGINEIIKEGEMLVEIVPDKQQYAVELFIRPVDLPLVRVGQPVRFIFDGFPAIVFSGWPKASYGIFSGKVTVVENAVSDNGLFRVLVAEEVAKKSWPPQLRIGTGASGIALLKDVPIWYELWRNINGFPPDFYKTTNQALSKENKN
ncbi:MAG: HlyD family secretion protein [Chitinophagaceae bacterium]